MHTPSFLRLKYSDDFILLELAFISGRSKETRLALLKELNARIVAGAGISPDDLMVHFSEDPGENYSFGRGLAQRAFISQPQEGVTRTLIDPAFPAALKSSSDSGGETNMAEAVIVAALVRAKAGKEKELARWLHVLVEASRSSFLLLRYCSFLTPNPLRQQDDECFGWKINSLSRGARQRSGARKRPNHRRAP